MTASKVNSSINLGACVGLGETVAANVRNSTKREHDRLDSYAGNDFFDDENFRAALERMNGGYDIAQDLIRMMEDYCEIDRNHTQNLLSFSRKWIKHFKNQPMISSYHTTKRAQIDTIHIAKHLAYINDNRCNALQDIINNYRRLIDETYMHVHFTRRYEHCRYREFKKLFKSAHISLVNAKTNLDKLHDRIHRIEQTILNTDKNFEKMANNEVINEKKLMSKSIIHTKYETELKRLETKMKKAEEIYANTKQAYRKKAKEIFSQCQQIEKQRLEQIREILLVFIRTMHIRKYVPEIEKIYDELISNITTQQNSLEDLVFWAHTYGIDDNESVSVPLSNADLQTTTNDELRITIAPTTIESSAIDDSDKEHKSKDKQQ
ncbi:unnamed protein product [Rotaria sp. Silwood1]|nr:unnamed protein product [Rotaria sp. Silwood1]CAF3768212.1 unnamed protein product [Rotaria sp. Silwood1]CAF3842912.1 unnamed protein product [Rotaria sp. Silwood1]CAF4694463.1 unnamed protein product [Rotaria sp. Silwood1]CAF4808879.1 unnamed protein product [Rotaria sp. Silwood1]